MARKIVTSVLTHPSPLCVWRRCGPPARLVTSRPDRRKGNCPRPCTRKWRNCRTSRWARTNADLTGDNNRVLQAAVDYVAGLGGGVVEIGAGEYPCTTRCTCGPT